MAGVRSKPERNGKYRGWFSIGNNKRREFTGTRSRRDTLKMVQKLEDEHLQARLGYRSDPSASMKNASRQFCEIVDEYLDWGRAQGGRGGRPWSKTHAGRRECHLRWWEKQLRLVTLGDLLGIKHRVEAERRNLLAGRAGKTVANYVEALSALCDWCVEQGFLDEDPLKQLSQVDTSPEERNRRRALSEDEFRQLLDCCAPHRQLLLWTAAASGLRTNELRSLRRSDLDVKHSQLRLDASWTKNRQMGYQPIPLDLAYELEAFAKTREADKLYERFYRAKNTRCRAPEDPLLYVPINPARDMEADLEAAGIEKHTPEGKVDFHALRVAFINFVIDSGASVREAQALARHSTPQLTMNTYARARDERLVEAVEKVGAAISPNSESAHMVHLKVVGGEDLGDNQNEGKGLEGGKPWCRRGDSNPHTLAGTGP